MTNDYLPSPASEKPQDADQIQKNLESFAAFDQWMDEQLEELVATWIHSAAPNASRSSRREMALKR